MFFFYSSTNLKTPAAAGDKIYKYPEITLK